MSKVISHPQAPSCVFLAFNSGFGALWGLKAFWLQGFRVLGFWGLGFRPQTSTLNKPQGGNPNPGREYFGGLTLNPKP